MSSSPTDITHWRLSDLRTPLESVPMVENDLWWVESVQTGHIHWNEWEFEIWEYCFFKVLSISHTWDERFEQTLNTKY